MSSITDVTADRKPLLAVDGPDGGTVGDTRYRRGRTAGWMVSAIHGYQLLRTGRPTGCRFIPTCSEYAVQAIEGHGAVHGGALAARRLVRCNPWGGHGVDPVPDGRTSCSHP
jgi:hypothetical protein